MGCGCCYRIIIEEPVEEETKLPNSGVNECCMADNLELRFAAKSGKLLYAYLICKTCGNMFTYHGER